MSKVLSFYLITSFFTVPLLPSQAMENQNPPNAKQENSRLNHLEQPRKIKSYQTKETCLPESTLENSMSSLTINNDKDIDSARLGVILEDFLPLLYPLVARGVSHSTGYNPSVEDYMAILNSTKALSPASHHYALGHFHLNSPTFNPLHNTVSNIQKARKNLLIAAKLGHAKAKVELAKIYLEDLERARNLKIAHIILHSAIQQGNQEAYELLQSIPQTDHKNDKVEKYASYPLALLLEEEFESICPKAGKALDHYFETGEKTADYDQLLLELHQAADYAHPEAEALVALEYATLLENFDHFYYRDLIMEVVNQNDKTGFLLKGLLHNLDENFIHLKSAKKNYENAASLGDPVAELMLACLYVHSPHTKEYLPKIVELLANPTEISFFYLKRTAFERRHSLRLDDFSALKAQLYQAAQEGEAQVKYTLAKAYYKKCLFPFNFEMSQALLEEALALGYLQASCGLGRLHEKASADSVDPQKQAFHYNKAKAYYNKAIKAKHPQGFWRLAKLYHKPGPRQNLILASELFRAAAKKGVTK